MTENRNNLNIPNNIIKISITILMTLALTLTQFTAISAEEMIDEGEVIEEGSLTIDPNHQSGDEEEIVAFELNEDPIQDEYEISDQQQIEEEGESEHSMISAEAFSLKDPTAAFAVPNKILGFITAPKDETVNIYTTATSGSTITYISNQPFNNGDAAILDETSTRYKIKIAGVVGWVNKNVPNMRTYNTADVKSISHYQVNDTGDLIHYLSKGPQQTSYSLLNNGKAPSYLTKKTQYYSYDGHYFYTNKDTMINDYKKDSYNNAVANGGKPFFNYFQFLPYRSLSNISGQQLDDYITNVKKFTETIPGDTNVGIKDNQSNMVGTGTISVWQGNKYGTNGLITFSLGIHESGWGRSYLAANRKNLFGHKAYDSTPGSATAYEHIYDSFWVHNTKFLNWSYLDFDSYLFKGGYLGNKESGINVKYASDPYWGEKAASHYHALDRYFGNADYNGYRLGVKTAAGTVNIKKEATNASETMTNKTEKYSAQLREKNQVVVILGEAKGQLVAGSDIWYKISIDSLVESSTRDLLYIGPTVNGDREHREAGYDFQQSYGYVHSSQLTQTGYNGSTVINPPVTKEPVVERPKPPVVTPPVITPPDEKTRLDLHKDGQINISDMMIIRRHALGVKLLSGEEFKRADLNGDGELNISDMMVIRRYIIKVGR